jgi:heptaprenylglyceryl phosphate synthase
MRRRALLFQEVAHRRMVTFECDTHTNIIVVGGTRNRDLTLGLTLKEAKTSTGLPLFQLYVA